MTQQYVPPTYPVLAFIARSGMTVAIVVALVALAAGAWIAYATGLWFFLAAGVAGAIVLGGLLASYVELVRIIMDTLVPR